MSEPTTVQILKTDENISFTEMRLLFQTLKGVESITEQINGQAMEIERVLLNQPQNASYGDESVSSAEANAPLLATIFNRLSRIDASLCESGLRLTRIVTELQIEKE